MWDLHIQCVKITWVVLFVESIRKCAANEDIIDIYGNTVQKDSEYIMRHYLEKVHKKKDKIYYKELPKPEYI